MIEPEPQVQYISDEKGKVQGVIVPIELGREILSERETAYLLKSDAMKERLLEAMQRRDDITVDLDQLLSKVKSENLQGEIDWGSEVGKEVG